MLYNSEKCKRVFSCWLAEILQLNLPLKIKTNINYIVHMLVYTMNHPNVFVLSYNVINKNNTLIKENIY